MQDFTTNKFNKTIISVSGFILVFMIWTVLSRSYNSLILPSPEETGSALIALVASGELFKNIIITVRRTLMGFILAVIFGIIFAILLNKRYILRLIFKPLITVIQTTPPVVWLALAVIWFGIAENITPVFLIFIVTFPIIFINIFEGLQNLNINLLEMAQVYEVRKRRIYLEIFLPDLIPSLVSSLTIGFAFAWKSSIFAEFIGSNSGIGYALSRANSNLNTSELYAWTLILIGLMLLVEYMLIKPLQRRVSRWKQYE
ncbi:MAG: ABC transporter permease [Bacillota bacterium]